MLFQGDRVIGMIKLPLNFKDLSKDKMQLLIFIALVYIIVVILYLNFVFMPQITKIGSVLVKMAKMQADLKAAESDVAKMPNFQKDVTLYKEKIDRYEKMLPAEKEIPDLLEDLSSIAKSSNVKIVGITPVVSKEEKVQKGQIYKEIPILISAKSGYHELGDFLSKLENSDRFMKVVDIGIKATGSSPTKHDVELMVLTYVLLKGK